MGTIRSYRDLNAWQEAHKLALSVYKITGDFPKEEAFALTSQIRRAVVSVTSNLAEGFGRPGAKDKLRFYDMARGSLLELDSQLVLAKDLHYLDSDNYRPEAEQLIIVHKLINGLIRSTKLL